MFESDIQSSFVTQVTVKMAVGSKNYFLRAALMSHLRFHKTERERERALGDKKPLGLQSKAMSLEIVGTADGAA